MAKVIRNRRRPKNWSPGVLIAGIWILALYLLLDRTVTWWMLVIALVIVPVVDILVSGTTEQEEVEINKE
jgi:hypothetical protein